MGIKKGRYNVQVEYSFYSGLMGHRRQFRFARFRRPLLCSGVLSFLGLLVRIFGW